MTDATRHPVLYKLRYTPVFDFFRIGFTARLDLNRPLETAALPLPIKELIERVVRRTRLWRLEKLDVLTELIGHFTDGIAASVSADELIAAFGDEANAAKLIRRAKRRNRALYWQALRFASQSVAVVLAIYAGIALYFFSGRPSPRTNYVAILNETSLKTPEAERAWRIYRRVLQEFSLDRGNRIPFYVIRAVPDSEQRPVLLELIRQRQGAIEQIRQAAAKPAFGFVHGVDRSGYNTDPSLCPLPNAAEPAAGQALNDLAEFGIVEVRHVAALLAADASLAREARDRQRLLRDIDALLGLSRQVTQIGFLLSDIVSFGIVLSALDEIEGTLRQHPELLPDEDWLGLAHRFSVPQVAGDIVSLDRGKMQVDDLLQRTFTDNGSGDGRLTPEGARYFDCIGAEGIWLKSALQPMGGLLTRSRQTLASEHDRILDRARANFARPAREAKWDEWDDARKEFNGGSPSVLESINLRPVEPYLLGSVGIFLQQPLERNLGHRDGVLTGIALELYRRQHGAYPNSLDALVPQFLPKVPADRITGEPVRYRLVGGQPLIYSVGVDRKDDEGRPSADPQAAALWGTNLRRLPDGDWVLYPTPPEHR
jgi:hypothetical protein